MKPIIQIIFHRLQTTPDDAQRIHDYIISLGWAHAGTGYKLSDPRSPIGSERVSTYAFTWPSDQEPIFPDLPEGVDLYRWT